MIEDRKVVACIPAGRRRFLRLLLPQLLRCPEVDTIELWQNTDDAEDLAWMRENSGGRVSLVFSNVALSKALYNGRPDHPQFNDSVYRFYPQCQASNTMYVKVDDDIVYLHDGFFEALHRSLSQEPRPLFSIANVFNTPQATWQLHRRGLLDVKADFRDSPKCEPALRDGPVAEALHRQFLSEPDKGRFLWDSFDVGPGHQRIGAMAWFGEEFAAFGGAVGQYDELSLTVDLPQRLGRHVRFAGDALCSHYSFSHQMKHLDEEAPDVLAGYEALIA